MVWETDELTIRAKRATAGMVAASAMTDARGVVARHGQMKVFLMRMNLPLGIC